MAFTLDGFESILGAVTPILGGLGRTKKTFDSAKMQQRGVEMQAQGFRQAADATIQAAEYNNEILQINTQRRLEALGRQIRMVGGEQRVAAAASGFASTSQSKLAIMDATLDQFSRQIQNEVASLGHTQQANLFEAQSRAQSLETQARTTEFRGAQQQQGQGANKIQSLVNLATTSISSIEGLLNG